MHRSYGLQHLRHKRSTFAFTGESGYTLGFRRKIAHKGSHAETRGLPALGHSTALCCQRNPFYSTTLLYTYISRFTVNLHYQQREKIRRNFHHKFYLPTVPYCVSQLLSQMPHVCFQSRKRVHTCLRQQDRTQGLTRRNRRHFGWGAIITLDTNCTFTNIPGPGVRTANFAAFWPWSGVFPKNTESLRNSDALMRVAVPRRRGPAGLRNLFSFLSKLRFSHSVLRAFRVCET